MMEMTEQEKNKLAKLNELSQERYSDLVKENIRNDLGLQLEDEVAILRKFCAAMLSQYMQDHGNSLLGSEPIAEFIIHNANIELKKADIKEKL